jgi:3',5'-cyclic AMP phosphodiesterase CpdA
MTQCFAQISDPHLSSLEAVRPAQLLNKRLLGYLSWRRKRRFEHRREVLDALHSDLSGQTLDQLLISGDLTHIGLPSEFREARQWLQQLGAPRDVALVPGNHDACVAASWEDTFAHWEDYLASDDPPADGRAIYPCYRERGNIAFIGLSSACVTAPLMATGEVDAAQLEALPGLLSDARSAGLFRVVFIHHSPVPGAEKWRKRLRNALAVADILADNGVELVLHGHGHRARQTWLDSRDGRVPVLAVPSASALGLHGADLAAYNLYRVSAAAGGWRLDVESRRYDPGRSCFAPSGETSLVLERTFATRPDRASLTGRP